MNPSFESEWKSYCEHRSALSKQPLELNETEVERIMAEANQRFRLNRVQQGRERFAFYGAITAVIATILFALIIQPSVPTISHEPISLSDLWTEEGVLR